MASVPPAGMKPRSLNFSKSRTGPVLGERPVTTTTPTGERVRPDLWKAIAFGRIRAMLKPGGVFRLRDLFCSCALHETHDVIEGWLAGASTTPGVGWQRAELALHLREEYSTFTWLVEPMLEQDGFAIDSAEYGSPPIIADDICRKRA